MEKKEKKLKWYNIILAIIVSICIYFTMLLGVYSILNIKKSNAYTNNVVSYANEQITDLTGTSWTFYEDPPFVFEENFIINFNTNNISCVMISFYNQQGRREINYTTNNGWFTAFYSAWTGTDTHWNGDYRKIEITGGQDVTNTRLINYLYENAIIEEPEEPEEPEEQIYNISYNLQNIIIIGERPTSISNLEEINIEIESFNNYELPQNIMVENASYNWNYETGILTIYDANGNVNITIRAEYISGNYSFIELIDSVILIPLNTFFNLFNFELFGVNIYALLTATLTLFVIIKILLKVFK